MNIMACMDLTSLLHAWYHHMVSNIDTANVNTTLGPELGGK